MVKAREKIFEEEDLITLCKDLRAHSLKIVFTNGCFDILHLGHLRYLEEAKGMGDILVVAINSDSSVREIKGSLRPIIPELARAELVAGLHCVDVVTIFSDPTPFRLISRIKPDVLVKGGDWALSAIVGRDFVESYGGRVVTVPLTKGFSTSYIIERISKIHSSFLNNTQ
ncbi:MAG: D-glycero-beta-D-manno-heptose 1-phosphate adenylyltransferase [Syntrophobacterales bacterium]|nr:D-glycero-beta-D-manno-heptose 1-phosphate adenylyltransferase [Syntrophobacterales bacterium]